MSSVDVDRYIQELHRAVTSADLNYKIWWIYKSKETRENYKKPFKRYETFFLAGIHAHFVGCIISIYRVYETHKKTINIDSLLNLIPESEKAGLPEDFDERLKKAKNICKNKINLLRNNCFGHQNGEHTGAKWFADAAITGNNIKDLIDLTKTLLKNINYACNESTMEFNIDPTNDTISLLEKLST